MKVLIVGASSFIGRRIYKFIESCTKLEVYGTYFSNKLNDKFNYLDITDVKQIESILNKYKPDVVIWVAGSKNLKQCESDLEYSKKINYYPIKYYLEVYKKIECTSQLIFLSTDYVFDGVKGGYLDTDNPNPNTNYGLSNLLAEEEIMKSKINFTIIRTSAVMGKGGTFFDWITSELIKNKSVELLDNIYFSPTPIKLLLENIVYFINHRETGVFNVCGEQRLSRYEFGVILKNFKEYYISELIGVNSNPEMLFLQPDLSMVPSSICNEVSNKTMVEYLEEEINFG